MRRTRTRTLLAIGTALVLCASTTTAQRNPSAGPVFVGIVRADGLLLPVAVHTSTGWWNKWPFESEELDSVSKLRVPSSLDAIPRDWLPAGVILPRTWNLLMTDGTRRASRVIRAERPKANLMTLIGLRSEVRPQLPAEDAWMYADQELGVAAAGPARAGRFLPSTTEEVESVMRRLDVRYRAEEKAALADRAQLRRTEGVADAFTLNEDQRARAPFESVEILKAEAVIDGRTFYQVSTTKAFGGSSRRDCDALVGFQAIVSVSGDDLKVHSASAFAPFDCSIDDLVPFVPRPLATIEWSGPTVWLVRDQAEDGYAYGVLDPTLPDPGIPLKGGWELRARRP